MVEVLVESFILRLLNIHSRASLINNFNEIIIIVTPQNTLKYHIRSLWK
jgi:hypothetical protein